VHSVDVVLPFHRDDEFLRIAINSILASEDVLVRVLLVDDRVDAKPIPDLEQYIVCRTGGSGYATAINSVKDYLKSEFVSLMNSDDWSSPTRLVKQINALKDSDKTLSVCSPIKFRKSHIKPALLGAFTPVEYDSNVLILGAYGANATWLAHRETWIREISFEKSSISDWLTAMKVFPLLEIVHVNEDLYWYRQHFDQITNSNSQQHLAFRDLLNEAARIAKLLNVFDENFELNFQITAAPYSITGKPSKIQLLNAWRYLRCINDVGISGVENLLLRRRFFIALSLIRMAYLDFDTFRVLVVGGLDILKSLMVSIFQLPPKTLRVADASIGVR
jgi:glycosyltransferase involved in cell wall biosynthesis